MQGINWRFWLKRLFVYIDWPLFIGLLVLLMIGQAALFSAANQNPAKLEDQLFNFSIAVVLMWGVARIPAQTLSKLALPLYVLGVIMLLGVALFGKISHGAQRWLDIGFLHIQPSELMKVALPMTVAWYFDRFGERQGWWAYVVATILILIPFGFIVEQPDLGTSLLVASAGFYVLFLAGLSWYLIIAGILAFLPVLYVVTHESLCVQLLHQYQCTRIATLLDPSQDPLGAGYHTMQGTIAIGSGGFWGKGWFNGTQTHLDFIPERTTDFIVAVIGEEFGLLGITLLLAAYLYVIARCLIIARDAATQYGRLLAGAMGMTFITYVFVNMGMVAGILPVVGVPLPFVSYGGTALVTLMIGFGMLMGIRTHRTLMKG